MKAKVSEPETWKRVIDIEVPAETIEKLFEEKLSRLKKDLKIDGFRPGKVPESLVRQRYGEAIRADAVEEIIQQSFKDACTEHKILPISQGAVSNLKNEAGQPLTFSIETEVDPPVVLKGYDRVKIKVAPKKIKDADVDEMVKNLQERFAEFTPVERPAKKGDYITFEYRKVVIEGQERTDFKNPSYPVELGGENRLKDFDKGLIGHGSGETVTISIKFPKEYAEKEVAGKEGEFTLAVTAVLEKKIPEVAVMLEKMGGPLDEEALRNDLQGRLEAEALEQAKNAAFGEAIETLINENQFEVPPARIESFFDYLMEEAKREKKPGEALPTREEIATRYREMAIRSIKRQRILDYIAEQEKIAATQEEVDVEIRRIADQYQQPFDQLKLRMRQNGTTLRIRDDIRERKTLEFLVELPETRK